MLIWGVLFMYVVLSVIVTYPLVFHLAEYVTNPIDPLLYVWNLHHNFFSLLSPSRNLLDTNMFYPATNTISYSDHLFGESILLFPFFFIIKNPLVIQNIYIISTFVFSAFGLYKLSYYLTKNHMASIVAGCIYSFSLYHLDHLGQVPTTSIQWIPFVFLYLLKSYDSRHKKDLWLFWLFFTLNFLSTLYYGLFVGIGVFLFFILTVRSKQYVKSFLLTGIPFFILMGISLYPYIIFKLENPEVRRTIEESSIRSANVQDYMNLTPSHDRALFPGIIALITSLFALWKNKKHKALFFILLGICSVIFSLGPFYGQIKLPYYYLYHMFPLIQAIRVPARFGILFILSISMVSAYGITNLISFIKNKNIQYALTIVLVMSVVSETLAHHVTFASVPRLSEAPEVYTWLEKQPDGPVLILPLKSGVHSNPIEEQVYKTYDTISEDDNFIAETFRLYFSTIHKKNMVNGYSSYFPQGYSRIATEMESFPSSSSLESIRNTRITYLVLQKKQFGERFREIDQELSTMGFLQVAADFETEKVYTLKH